MYLVANYAAISGIKRKVNSSIDPAAMMQLTTPQIAAAAAQSASLAMDINTCHKHVCVRCAR